MKILVTGGAGFVGSHLCDHLLEKGHFVVCMDNISTGSHENIKHLINHERFEFVNQDITEPFKLAVGKLDQIYNLACRASPIHYQQFPVETVLANTLGVINLLKVAKYHNSRILQASTSEIYGDPEVHPQTEDYVGNVNCTGPRACYDEGKRIAETLFFDHHREYDVNITLARIFNTYGPRMHENDGRVVSNFIVQALKNKDITIYGSGEQTRSFCYVSDMVEGLYKLMNKEGEKGPINIGNPAELTIADMAKLIIELTGSESKIIYKELPKDDPRRRQPDITKAKEILQWKPTIELKDGLIRTINYFKTKV